MEKRNFEIQIQSWKSPDTVYFQETTLSENIKKLKDYYKGIDSETDDLDILEMMSVHCVRATEYLIEMQKEDKKI